jgi:DNA-binding MarR family transcriptional regulator
MTHSTATDGQPTTTPAAPSAPADETALDVDDLDDPLRALDRPPFAEVDAELDLDRLLNSFRLLVLHHSRVLSHQGGQHGLGLTDLRFLFYVSAAGDSVTPKRAAEYLELSSGAMTNLVDRLIDSGHLDRRPNPDDRRSVIVSRTEAGREAVREIADVYRRSFSEVFEAPQYRGMADAFLDFGAALDRNGALPAE